MSKSFKCLPGLALFISKHMCMYCLLQAEARLDWEATVELQEGLQAGLADVAGHPLLQLGVQGVLARVQSADDSSSEAAAAGLSSYSCAHTNLEASACVC